MSNLLPAVWRAQFEPVEVDGRSLVVCKQCKRQMSSNNVGRHSRMHNKQRADMASQADPPAKKPLCDMPASNQESDISASNTLPDKSASEVLPEKSQAADADVREMTRPLEEQRAKDATRYLALCASSPIAFRRAIDALPNSSIIRIYALICSVAKGDAHLQLSPTKRRRLCSKYGADVRASSKTKRRLLRSADKETIRSFFGPLLLQTAFGGTDSGVMPTALQAITASKPSHIF